MPESPVSCPRILVSVQEAASVFPAFARNGAGWWPPNDQATCPHAWKPTFIMNLARRFTLAAISACIAGVLLSACASDPKAANNANFTTVLDRYLATTQQGALCLPSLYYPHPRTAADTPMMKAYQQQLISAGLVQKRTQMYDSGFGYSESTPLYVLTAQGKAHLSSNAEFTGSTFCFARLQVGSIVKFTEPGALMGITVSEVTYIPKIVSIDSWATRLRLPQNVTMVKMLIAQGTLPARKLDLDLTNIGWEVAH